MTFQIKALSGTLDEDQKKYLRKRFLWLEEHLPKTAVFTVGVREHIIKKSNQAFEILVHVSMPKFKKKPLYVKSFGNDFKSSVDKAKNRIERMVAKNKEKTGKIKFLISKISIRRKISDGSI